MIVNIVMTFIAAGVVVFLSGCMVAMMYLGIYKESENGIDGRTGVENPGMAAGTQQQDATK